DGDGLGRLLAAGSILVVTGGDTPRAQWIDVLHKANLIGTRQIPDPQLETGTNFADVFIRVTANGTVDLQYNGMVIFNQVALPGYTAFAGGEFVFAARTGGLNEIQWFDNIAIATTVGVNQPTLGFSRSGNILNLTWGAGFKLQS